MQSSRRISSRRASTPASAYVITRPCSDMTSFLFQTECSKHMLIYGVRRWLRTVLGEFNRLIDKLFHFLIGSLQLAFVHSMVKQPLAAKPYWVLLFPLLNFVAGSIIRARVAFVMAHVAIRFAFARGGAATLASTADRRFRGGVNRLHILPVNLDAQHPVRCCTTRNAGVLRGATEGHFRRVQVVLTHIHDGQAPDRTEIDGFVKRTTIDRTLAKKADNHLALLTQFGAKRAAGREENGSAHNSVGAHKPVFGRVHVHAAATSPGTSRGLTPKLGQHDTGRYAFGQGVTMAAMRAKNEVDRFEIRTISQRATVS